MKLQSQAGFTLVEVMAAAVIATIVAYASFSVFPFLRKTAITGRSSAACQNYLSANFARIEQLGTSPRIIDPALPTYKNGETVQMLPPTMGMSGEQMTPKKDALFIAAPNSNDTPIIRTGGLYISSVVLVNAIYANNPGVCSGLQFSGAALGSGLLTQPAPDIDHDFKATLQIVPINLATRAPLGNCTTPGFEQTTSMQIAPKGKAMTATEADTLGLANFDARNNVGYNVTLSASYTIPPSTQVLSCSETRQIAYTADLIGPPSPLVSITYDNAHVPAWPVTWSANSADVNLTYTGEEGVVLLCKDSSTFVGDPDPAGKTPGSHLTADPVPVSNNWVPCYNVSLCGRQPHTPATYTGTTSGNFTIQRHWGANSIPYGCSAQISAVAVDPAGNVSPTTQSTVLIADNAGPGPGPGPSGPPCGGYSVMISGRTWSSCGTARVDPTHCEVTAWMSSTMPQISCGLAGSGSDPGTVIYNSP